MESIRSSITAHRNTTCHLCTEAIKKLLQTISSGANKGPSDSYKFQDLVTVLERVLSTIPIDSTALNCQFCPLTPDINHIADCIQSKLNGTMKDQLLWMIRQLRAVCGEHVEDLPRECRMLKQLLQSILVHESKPMDSPSSTSSAAILDRAHNIWIDGAEFTNVAGNSTSDPSSNFFIYVQPEPGIGFRGVLALVLALLFFRRS